MYSNLEEFCARFIPYGCSICIGTIGWFYANLRGVIGGWFVYVFVMIVWLVYCFRSKLWVFVALVSAGVVFIGTLLYTQRFEASHTYHTVPLAESVEFSGVISSMPDVRYATQFLTITPDFQEYRVRVKTDKYTQYVIGDRVFVQGKMVPPESFVGDSGVVFDYARYLAVGNIVALVDDARVVQTGEHDTDFWLQRHLQNGRNALVRVVERFLPTDSLGLALGTTIGTRDKISDDMMDSYRVAGISHIVVLSGFNVSIIAVVLGMFLRRFALSRQSIVLVAVAFVWLFIGFVGFSTSVVRAGIMLTCVLMAGLFDRQGAGIRALLYACVIMVLINPRILLDDVGFQLSVSATFGLFVVAPYIERRLPELKSALTKNVREIVISTMSATIATLPILIYEIGALSGWGLVSNMLIVWVVPFIMAGVLGIVVTAWFPLIAQLCAIVTTGLVGYVNTLSIYFRQITPDSLKTNAVLALVSGVFIVLSIFMVSGRRPE